MGSAIREDESTAPRDVQDDIWSGSRSNRIRRSKVPGFLTLDVIQDVDLTRRKIRPHHQYTISTDLELRYHGVVRPVCSRSSRILIFGLTIPTAPSSVHFYKLQESYIHSSKRFILYLWYEINLQLEYEFCQRVDFLILCNWSIPCSGRE